MSTRTCTLLLHTSRVDYSSTLYRDLPRSTERYGADTDSESDAEETMGTLDATLPNEVSCRRASASIRCMLDANEADRPVGTCHHGGKSIMEG